MERLRGYRFFLGAIVACVAAIGFAQFWRTRHHPHTRTIPIRIQWIGCRQLAQGRCVREPNRPLRILLPSSDFPVVRIDGGDAAPVAFRPLETFAEHRVYAIDGDPRGLITIHLGSGEAAPFTIDDEPTTPDFERLQTLRRQGLFDSAMVEADALLPTLSGRMAFRTLALAARCALASGIPSDAVTRLKASAALARELHYEDDEAVERLVASYVYSTRIGNSSEALALVDGRDGFWKSKPQHLAHQSYYRGLAAWLGGDSRRAVADLTEASRLFKLLGNDELGGIDATSSLSSLLAGIGRPDDALALVKDFDPSMPALQTCTGVFFANNAAFAALRSAERHDVAGRFDEDAREKALAQARQWTTFVRSLAPDKCRDRAAWSLTDVHEAELARLGHDSRALASLVVAARSSKALVLPVVDLAWQEFSLDEAVTARDVPSAEARAKKLSESARAIDQPHSEWAAHVALARLHRGTNATRARAALEAAERVLDRTLEDVALGDGRSAFLAAHERSASALFELLLGTKDFAAAELLVSKSARRALESAASTYHRARALSPAQETALSQYREVKLRTEQAAAHDWELPAFEVAMARQTRARNLAEARGSLESTLAAGGPKAGAVAGAAQAKLPFTGDENVAVIFVHSTPTGYAALMRVKTEYRVARVDEPISFHQLSGVAARLLKPLLANLGPGFVLHLTTVGPIRSIDWGRVAALGDGSPLILQFSLVEHLGLAPIELPARPASAFVVADANGDLPYAAREGAFVRDRLPATAIIGGAASRAAVAEAFETASFLHYAGHGLFAGADGFESELLLGKGETISVSDVLLLAHVPAMVVLSGCELSRSNDDSGESFGIAQALIVRGTSWAIAPTRKVNDQLAERFVHALYNDGPLDTASISRRMQQALATLAKNGLNDDWGTFRLLAR